MHAMRAARKRRVAGLWPGCHAITRKQLAQCVWFDVRLDANSPYRPGQGCPLQAGQAPDEAMWMQKHSLLWPAACNNPVFERTDH